MIAVVGPPDQVAGFGLAGACVVPALTAPQALQAWSQLTDASVVILTPTVAGWLGTRLSAPGAPLTVVLPQ